MTRETADRHPGAEGLARSRSLPQLASKLVSDLTDLFSTESALIRAELSDKVSQVQVGVGKLLSGALILLVALVTLTDALVVALAELIGDVNESAGATGWAALIVGTLFAAIGTFLVRSGTTDLQPENLMPDRTTEQVQRDTELAKEQMR